MFDRDGDGKISFRVSFRRTFIKNTEQTIIVSFTLLHSMYCTYIIYTFTYVH